MPRGNYRTDGINQAGYGQQGYCKLCAIADQDKWQQYQQRVKAGWSPNALNKWVRTLGWDGLVVSRETLYRHREHLEHPQDRLVTAVQKTQQAVAAGGAKSTPTEFLEAVVQVGAQRVASNPEEVTIDQALKAAAALSQHRSVSSGLSQLINAITSGAMGMKQVTIIEGDATEVQ